LVRRPGRRKGADQSASTTGRFAPCKPTSRVSCDRFPVCDEKVACASPTCGNSTPAGMLAKLGGCSVRFELLSFFGGDRTVGKLGRNTDLSHSTDLPEHSRILGDPTTKDSAPLGRRQPNHDFLFGILLFHRNPLSPRIWASIQRSRPRPWKEYNPSSFVPTVSFEQRVVSSSHPPIV